MKKTSLIMATIASLFTAPTITPQIQIKSKTKNRSYSNGSGKALARGKRHKSLKERANRRKK